MRAARVLLLACVLPLSLIACKPRTVTDSSRSIYCEVTPDAPNRNDDDKPTKVIGKVRYRCDEPGASTMQLTISLQKQNSAGAWITIAQVGLTASGAQTVPDEGAFRSREVSAACSDGVFRTHVTGTTRARGTTKKYERAGPRSFDPCRPGIFAGKP
jgi:hypothetical protein